MNTILKIVAGASLCLLSATASRAQDYDTREETKPVAQLQKKWFDFDETKTAGYQFTIQLDKGESLLVKFKKLSDWTSAGDFMNALSATDKVVAAYKDSLLQEQNTQVLDIHIPANQKNIISRFNQYNESGNMMTFDSDGASALKLGVDTLRVLQVKAGMTKIQYRFLLKKLSNYSTFSQDEGWKNKTAGMIDSIVSSYRNKWKKPDAGRHALTVSYNPYTNKTTMDEGRPLKGSTLLIEGGIGISLVRNTLCPNAEYGLGIYLSRTSEASTFLRVSSNAFYRFVETSPNKYKGYATSFINLEIGGESNHKNPKALFYKTSLGFGYKLINKKEEDRDPTMSKQMYRMFFSYSINKFFVLTPEFVTNFKKGDNNNKWFGLSLNLKIL